MIDSLKSKPLNLTQSNSLKQNSIKSSGKDVAQSFESMLAETNQLQIQAEQKVNEMVAGKNKDIPGTMLMMEKADVSMKMLMAVRNKIVNAYEEVMRMQV